MEAVFQKSRAMLCQNNEIAAITRKAPLEKPFLASSTNFYRRPKMRPFEVSNDDIVADLGG